MIPYKQQTTSSILLLGRDRRLVETRQWVLEQAGFRVRSALSLLELEAIAAEERVDLFLLCNSLHQETRNRALSCIHAKWPEAKRLVLTPYMSFHAFDQEEQVLQAVEVPGKLVATVRTLVPNSPYPVN